MTALLTAPPPGGFYCDARAEREVEWVTSARGSSNARQDPERPVLVMSPLPLLEPTLEELAEVARRQAGWNGYDVEAPRAEAVRAAEAWLSQLHLTAITSRLGWVAPHVTSGAEGEIVFEWWNGPRKLTLYVEGAGREIEGVMVYGPELEDPMEPVTLNWNDRQGRLTLWRWLRTGSADE